MTLKQIAIGAAILACTSAFAGDILIKNDQLGSGIPAQTVTIGDQQAEPVGDGMYFIPQQLSGYPTAATIWPRAVQVECVKTATGLQCDGFNYSPKLGRGEYLFVIPVLKQQPQPTVIIKEVSAKKKAE